MPHLSANGIDLCYESFGAERDPAVVLIMGFAVQMLGWDERFCRALAGRGFRVLRFDNRDVGLSQKCAALPPYALDDMARDVVGLCDALGIDAAHFVGASMGGMIAQLVAIGHGARVRSLTSIMSTTGAQGVGWPHPDAVWVLLQPPPTEREAYIEHMIGALKKLGSPAYPVEDQALRERIVAGYDRSYYPAGAARQWQAVITAWDRTEALSKVTAPTLVIHGDADLIVQPDGGDATARAVPGAKHVRVEGMGHDLPVALWPTFIDAIVENARRAGS